METVELKVAGMTCGGCEASVKRALERIEGVTEVRADHGKGIVAVEAEGEIERSALESAVEDAGFSVVSDGGKNLPLV